VDRSGVDGRSMSRIDGSGVELLGNLLGVGSLVSESAESLAVFSVGLLVKSLDVLVL
jgi:hypothetical protein